MVEKGCEGRAEVAAAEGIVCVCVHLSVLSACGTNLQKSK